MTPGADVEAEEGCPGLHEEPGAAVGEQRLPAEPFLHVIGVRCQSAHRPTE